MADIERWITINGTHIPIMKGESKMAAVGRFIKGKSAQKLKRRFGEKMIDKYEYTADPYYEGEKYSEEHIQDKYGKNWKKYNKHDIKGYETQAKRQQRADAEFQPKHEANMKEFYEKAKGKSGYEQEKLWAETMEKGGKLVEQHIKTTHPRYKLKEDKRTLSRMETAKEIKDRTLKRYNDAKAAHYDSTVDGYKLYDSGLTKALNKVRKENDKDLPKLERAIKYQGYIAADGTNKMKVYKSDKLAKELQRRRNIDDAFKAVYGVSLDEFNKTYKKRK